MPNSNVFPRAPKGKVIPQTDAVNAAGGVAYALSPEQALATYACTGTINNTFYTTAEQQFSDVLQMCEKVSPEFIAKTAVYARTKGYMKDMPCLLLAVLLTKDTSLFKRIFPKVIDNVKMLRSFVQILRSGALGRKSFGTVVTNCIRNWFDSWDDADKLFNSSVGSNPSLADIIRLAHPKPKDETFSALFAYLCGFPHDPAKLPANVRLYEHFKKDYAEGKSWDALPNINFQYLTSVPLTRENWVSIAKDASWQTTRMNLNAFQRNGVFDRNGEDPVLVNMIFDRLRNPEEIAKSKIFPYTLLSAYIMTETIPHKVREALQDAMELSISNVPKIEGKVIVAIDVSGSMQHPVTGSRGSGTTMVKCVDVAGLMGAAIKRMNTDAVIISFDTVVHWEKINPRDSVMTNAQKLSRNGGGTDTGCAIKYLNDNNIRGDLLVIVSDDMSWFNSGSRWDYRMSTPAQQEWTTFNYNNPGAKCVCIDIQPTNATQLKESADIINVGGFSDAVFDLLAAVARGSGKDTFVNLINSVEI